ncbi:hypothetical protein BT69DRAFT_1280817 [Atractiella rhizophila]|nr:hypothetical protein BT69DRAFT_1280817 [Atractiella rhizophila]
MSSKLSYLSLKRAKNVLRNDGAINLHITINTENVSVAFLAVGGHTSSIERDFKSESYPLASYFDPFTRTFPFFRQNAIFAPIASYSTHKRHFIPIGENESSSLPSLTTATIIQLSVPPLTPCSISRLPVELLSLAFSFLDQTSNLSNVCELWKEVSVPYWDEPHSLVRKYEWLKRYPSAGRLWNKLTFDKSMDVRMVKEVIAGSPNVTEVVMDAFWNEEEASIVLNAIEGLERMNDVTFRKTGSRKWRKEKIENFMQRMGDRIRKFRVWSGVEDSPASASAGLRLSSRLEYLGLDKYPPLPSLSLSRTLKHLQLSNMCPLPSSISDYTLPPLLEYLNIKLSPFSVTGKTSILPTPLDLSHLTHLTDLFLYGGEETSNLVSRKFFSTLKNATVIQKIWLSYCVVDSSDFPDFIRWFFGDWRLRGAEKGDREDGSKIGEHLQVHLFFGEWSEEEIAIARSTMAKYARTDGSGIWEPGD